MSRLQRTIVTDLVRVGVLRESFDMANNYSRKFANHPELIQSVLQYTSYLHYDAPLNVRIQCIVRGISEQPICKTCKSNVEMRVSGRYRYTFPTHCSQKCVARDPIIVERKRQTNLARYGVDNPLKRNQMGS